MGLGGPLGGYIADRWGWRWAFLCQIPLFIISFILTGINLRYVTPVSYLVTTKSMGGILANLGWSEGHGQKCKGRS